MTDRERIEALEGQVAMLKSSIDILRSQVANLMSFPVYQLPDRRGRVTVDQDNAAAAKQ